MGLCELTYIYLALHTEARVSCIGLPGVIGIEEAATVGRITRNMGEGSVLWGGESRRGGKTRERRKDGSLGRFDLLIFHVGKSEGQGLVFP